MERLWKKHQQIKLIQDHRIRESSLQTFFKPITIVLSDAGLYSYCALCAISLHNLFSDEWDRTFRERCLRQLIRRLNLPSQVWSGMHAFMSGESGDVDPLIQVLRDELHGNCLQIVEDSILFAVEEGEYDARMRVLIHHMAWLMRVEQPLVEIYEESVVEMISDDVQGQTEEEHHESKIRNRNKKIKRYLMIGVATLGGGALMGLTGGLAAPFVAAGAGAIIGGAGAAALGSAAGIAVISSLFGVAGAGLTGYKMKKRVGGIEEFAFETLTEGQQLHITLAVSGWLSEEGPEGFQEPWQTLMHSREQYCLRYESTYFLELGRAMDYLFSFAVSMAAQEALKYTILSGLITAITWPSTIITIAGIIDNPWGVCINRSAEVGRHLADVLLGRQQGNRPVTLIGFSLGARVIYYCLQEMSKRKGCEGIIEDAILLGAPISADINKWKSLARVVCGKIINGYCRGDWLLKYLYRTSSATMNIAGLQPIKWNNRRMCNVDLSDIVSGHMDYARKMDMILKAIGVRTKDETDSKLRKSHSDSPVSRSEVLASDLKNKSKSEPNLRIHNPVILESSSRLSSSLSLNSLENNATSPITLKSPVTAKLQL
ncbi:transmembrane and coiled-coil domain-containing protein 4-like isoform X1 [Centruroides vittatus]|uniref:transmembrane and coiled-coil domain-containing protein 4-like isoform X1 n=2 Tax=Centruroides vittatus TaxID=120091 RepID=UPI003510115A